MTYKQIIKRFADSYNRVEKQIQLRKARVDSITSFLDSRSNAPGHLEWTEAYADIIQMHMIRILDLNDRLLVLEKTLHGLVRCRK